MANNTLKLSKRFTNGLDTAPIQTGLKDQKIMGAIPVKSFNLPLEAPLDLACNWNWADMYYNYLYKSQNGTISLHTCIPMQQSKLVRDGAISRSDTVHVFVATSTHNGRHERNVGTVDNPVMQTAFSNGNIGNFERMFDGNKITGAAMISNITTRLIPASLKMFRETMYPTQFNGNSYPVGKVINRLTLNIWAGIQQINANEDLELSQKHEQIQNLWDQYQNLLTDWEKLGYLVKSNIPYAIDNTVKDTNSVQLGYANTNPELDYHQVYGTEAGQASFTPSLNRVYCTAIITDAETDEHGQYTYGIYPSNIRSKDELYTLEDEDEIRRTPEVCTRQLLIADGAGNPVHISARVADMENGTRDNRKITKRSRIFSQLPVGTQIIILGAKLEFKYCNSGTLAVRAEISDLNYKSIDSRGNNTVVGDIASMQEDIIIIEPEAIDNTADESDFASIDLAAISQATRQSVDEIEQAPKPEEDSQQPALQTDTQHDDGM